MVRSGVRIVGVDFPVTDKPAETRLVTGGKIPIVENLTNIAALPRIGFRFSLEPVEAPDELGLCVVRAYAEVT
jgi:kynurenine formamidase